jgi:hypothetical protein
MQKHTKVPKELELIRGTETLVMPHVNPELLTKITEEYEHWWKYDSVRSIVSVMRLLGEAHQAIKDYEVQVGELEAEIQRLGRIAQY